jgi:ATP-dependent helicase/nuclease subunit B
MTGSRTASHLFDAPRPRYFSIDAGRPFLSDLAEGLHEALGGDIAPAEIFVPTRRAARGLADAFLLVADARGRKASLLPRIRAIGDIDEDEIVVFAGDAIDEIELLPALSSTERLMALARLIAARDQAHFAGQTDWAGAVAAARELGKLLDSFYAEEIPLNAIANLDVEGHADHWAKSLTFLEIVTTIWPAFLAERGRSDPAERRHRLVSLAAERFRNSPPDGPVIIAGTTASAPAVRRLVQAIAALPRGLAVFPGLDRSLDEPAWRVIDDAHPQSGLKHLLDALGVPPASVAPFPRSGGAAPRAKLLTLALRPAAATDDWLRLTAATAADDPKLERATTGLRLIEADNEEAEAAAIAALFRETIETETETALLVTPDRDLARRVSLKMRRWNVTVDDSGGVPFANTRCGVFLRLVAGFVCDPGDPVSILALLRHPLTALTLEGEAKQRAFDAIDRALRGARPPNGLASIAAALQARDRLAPDIATAISVLHSAADAFAVMQDAPLNDLIKGHLAAAEQIATPDALWSGDDGETGAQFLAELARSAAEIGMAGSPHYPDVFTALVSGVTVRRRSDAHPRLAILGPLEARLQSADRIILGGLNEGVWPAEAGGDPFLSRRMRKDLRLPSPERRIGLSAHDFAELAAQGLVTLTRSRRAAGKPAKPSRWLVRLQNILKGAGAVDTIGMSRPWRSALATLDAPDKIEPSKRPAPLAGPIRRPTELSVTEIETWLRDPYSIYARRILNLRKLEDPGEPFGAQEMGTLLHRVFFRAGGAPAALSRGDLDVLFAEEAVVAGLAGADRLFWSGAVAEALDWFAMFDAEQRRHAIASLEVDGALTFSEFSPPFKLKARADRIDVTPDGRAAIYDYKTGKLPSVEQIRTFSPQLPLTGLIAETGGFAGLPRLKIGRIAYLKAARGALDERKNLSGCAGEDAAETIRLAADELRKLIGAYDRPDARYHSQPRPQFQKDHGDYDQLARRKEWGALGESGEDA